MQQSANTRIEPAILAFLLGLAAIVGAWAFQIAGDLVPCPLCLQQRWPYYLGLPIIAAGLALGVERSYRSTACWMFAVAALIFCVGSGLGIYHSGVEWGWWQGPSGCVSGAGSPADAGALLQQMQITKVVPCDEAAWRLLGLSLAGYNALASFTVVILLLATMRRIRRA